MALIMAQSIATNAVVDAAAAVTIAVAVVATDDASYRLVIVISTVT